MLAHDGHFLLERRIVDPLIEAAAFERIVHFARSVRRKDDERWFGRANGAKFGNGDLKLREQLEKKSFELFVRTIDFVDQQNGRTRAPGIDRLQQRALDEKCLAVEIAPGAFAIEGVRRLEDTQLEELTGIVPLVKRVADVEPLVTLQTNQVSPDRSRHR